MLQGITVHRVSGLLIEHIGASEFFKSVYMMVIVS